MRPNNTTDKLTHFISTELKSRQEEVPLLQHYIDYAKCEPLHLKNNVVKELFMKILNVVLGHSNLPQNMKGFTELHVDNLFVSYIAFVKSDMNCNYLAKKLISWFNENRAAKKRKRFRVSFPR